MELIRRCYPYAKQLVRVGLYILSRMQLSPHTTRRTHHGASRFEIVASLVQRKLGVRHPAYVGMREQWLYDRIQDNEYSPPPLPLRPPVINTRFLRQRRAVTEAVTNLEVRITFIFGAWGS